MAQGMGSLIPTANASGRRLIGCVTQMTVYIEAPCRRNVRSLMAGMERLQELRHETGA